MTRRTILLLILVIVLVVVVVGTVTGVALARWNRKTEDIFQGNPIVIESGIENGSAKYLFYVPLDIDGNVMTANYVNDSYVFTGASSVAVVGYSGTIGEVYVPSTYSNNGDSYTVTKVLADSHLSEYAFAGNQFITRLVLPSTVIYVGDSVCSNMTQLEVLECGAGSSVMSFGQYAFLNCGKLTTLIIGGQSSTGVFRSNYAFYQTPVY